MRAAVLYGPGGPDAFRIEEVDTPAPGPGEVLVQVMACGVSSRDVVERNGTYRRDVRYPLILGLEISGVVRAVGSDVPSLKDGDHVVSKAFSSCGRCRLCRSGRESTCFDRVPVRGGYGEYAVLPWDALVVVARETRFVDACSLGPAVGVALNAVRDVAGVALGDYVLVTGATGGVGFPAVQLAKAAGGIVLAAVRELTYEDQLRAAGADHVVRIGEPDFASVVRGLTGGVGVDVIVDTVGSPVFDHCFKVLAVHGRYALVGQLNDGQIAINPARIFFKRAALVGVGSVSRAQLADAVRLAQRGVVHQPVARVLPLDSVAEAHRIVERGGLLGRVVLTPGKSEE